MKTIILEKPEVFSLVETAAPGEPAAGNALVRVRRVGICGSDISAYKGKHAFLKYPRILGHELGVEIVAIGANDRGLAVGDRCAVLPYLNCGVCSSCLRGRPNCCLDLKYFGVHIDGGMRELIEVPLQNLYKSSTLSFETLALVEMLTIGAHAVGRAGLEVGEAVLVLGAGPIGLSVIQFALQAGARLLTADVSPQRLAFCRRYLPGGDCLEARDDLLPQLEAQLAGELPTVVFDATGSAESMKKAFQYVAHGGRLVFVGVVKGDICFNDADFHLRELTVMSSRNSTGEDFAQTIRLLETGQIDVATWITHRAAAEVLPDRFPAWVEPNSGVIKAIVEF